MTKYSILLEGQEIEDLVSMSPSKMKPVVAEISRQYLRKILQSNARRPSPESKELKEEVF